MKWLPVLLASFAFSTAGCGTRYLDQETVQDGIWTDKTGRQFCKSMAFQHGGRAVVTFRGAEGDVEIPASYSVPDRRVAAGIIELRYETTGEQSQRYRAALKKWKSDSQHEADARLWPEELPTIETFQTKTRPGLMLVRADGTIIKLSSRFEQ